MALTPQDIQSQQFHVRFRGFDVDEVDDFLEKVAEDYLTAIQENKQLKERLDELTREISSYRDQEKTFQKAIMSAQQITDEMKRKSEDEANGMVRSAKEEADQLLNEAHAEITTLEKQLDDLKEKKHTIREDLRSMLNAYLIKIDETFDQQVVPARTVETEAEQEKQEIQKPQEGLLTTNDEVEAELEAVTEPEERPESFVKEEDDLSDLYQKVDLDDDLSFPDDNELLTDENKNMFSLEGGDDALPDIEGDMLFNLEDPLDDLAPDIKIKDEEDDNK